jgi:hypothetical protein
LIYILWGYPGLMIQVWQVNSSNFFVFLIDLFLNFILQYLVDWEFCFMFLLFTLCGVMMVSWSGSQVLWVSQIGSGFFGSFFNWFFFQFWSFNIVLIKNLTFYFFYFYVFISVSWFEFGKLTRVDLELFLFVFLFIFFSI